MSVQLSAVSRQHVAISCQPSAVSFRPKNDTVVRLERHHVGGCCVKNFRDLKVWEKAHHLSLAIYRVTAQFPRAEQFGLTSQMRRCTSSIPSNIAERCGRATNNDFAHFLQIALGSASELEYQLLLASDLGMLANPAYESLTGMSLR